MLNTNIDSSWKKVLKGEFSKPYFKTLSNTIYNKYTTGTVFPALEDIFLAFKLCPFEKVRVVILGQDPYHAKGQATGLSFGVKDNIKLPPSLKNIFKEIEYDLGFKPSNSGNLSRWATQGVLLLNSVLTVEENRPASHKNLGWEIFTDAVVSKLNCHKKNIVYMLWGNYAKNKCLNINKFSNLVLQSAHPSPFSTKYFFKNRHFSKCNSYLSKNNLPPINWT